MKPKFLNTIVFLIITPLTVLTIVLLLLTFLSTMKFSDKGIEQEDVSMISIYEDTNIGQHDLDVEYMNFKIYDMNIIEKNNQDVIKIAEGINETKESIKAQRTNNLQIENTQLIAGFTYQIKNTDWQRFKSNFSINFERMMVLSFSELFDGTTKL